MVYCITKNLFLRKFAYHADSTNFKSFTRVLLQNKLFVDTGASRLKYIGRNFMQTSMEQYMQIMKQTNSEMALELDRMPIGKFQ